MTPGLGIISMSISFQCLYDAVSYAKQLISVDSLSFFPLVSFFLLRMLTKEAHATNCRMAKIITVQEAILV